MANKSGADLDYGSLIRRAGFDPSDPNVYKFGVALLEQLADERDLEDVGNMTATELATYLTTEAGPESIFAQYLYQEWSTFAYVDPLDDGLLVIPITDDIYVDPEDSGLLVFVV